MTWVAEEIMTEDAATTGSFGDDARGQATTIRFHREDNPCALLTVAYYPEIIADPRYDGKYGVTGSLEYLLCTDPSDPGGTEVGSVIEYDYSPATIYANLGTAEAECQRQVRRWRESVDDFVNWDGKEVPWDDVNPALYDQPSDEEIDAFEADEADRKS